MTIILDGTAGATVDGDLSFNGGYGSAAAAYGCRAWVNFDGTGTVAIRASGNVSSITDGGIGIYTVNFTTAMPDADYNAVATYAYNATAVNSTGNNGNLCVNNFAVHSCRVFCSDASLQDAPICLVSFFR